MRRTLIVGVSLVAIGGFGVAVAGCGSSSKSTGTSATTTHPALTKAEYLKQGNAICANGSRAQQAAIFAYAKKLGVNPNSNTPPTKAQETKIANNVLIPHIQAQITKIKALGAPSGDQQKVDAALSAAQQALDKGKQDPTLFFANNNNLFGPAAKKLHAYGLTSCATRS